MENNLPAWPLPADEDAAQRLAARFAALGGACARFAKTAAGARVLAAIGGNSAYLSDLALAEPGILLAARGHAHATMGRILQKLHKLPLRASRAELSKALRVAKRQAALAIALADISGGWKLDEVTGALSALAEASLRAAVRHLLRGLHEQGSLVLPDPGNPEQGCGFVALALGKLGAAELNYSSDIDLVLLYDPQNPVYPPETQPVMAKLARELVALLSVRDEFGYVFRVDLRLRPDPGATPPVVSLQAALAYYESHGRTWERAAFSKARPVAGDVAMGEEFLAAIRPFIWRRHLDFAAIADIRGMKRQIDARQGGNGLLGHDVKLGRGGIREIEFIVQTLSLVWGGANPGLRIAQTLRALPALARAGHLPAHVARKLGRDYVSLRRVEHRLQMVADRQTHSLPASAQGLRAFAVFLNEPDFEKNFLKLLGRVHGHFLAFFDADAGGEADIDPGLEGKAPDAFMARLKEWGFADTQHIAERLRDWAGGTIPALRAERARELLETLLARLLEALGRQPEPDRAFLHFDTLLSRQRAGVQFLSLLARHRSLLERLAAVLGAAPALAAHLAQDAQALEALIAPSARFAAPRPVLRRLLRDAEDLERVVVVTRRFVRQEEFHLSVATLEGRLDANEAGRLRANLAKAALSALLPAIMAQHVARFGRVKGMKFAVVALGKTGSAEMLAGSDLDLMLVYDHAPLETPPTQYFVRIAHALTGALTAQGQEGPIYPVDMRLRPSGNQGPVAVSVAAFRRYHAADSWTWERLALTRAAVLAATPHFDAQISAEILTALCRPDPGAQILADTAAMLAKVGAEFQQNGLWDVKQGPGGLLEVAFIAEALQLVHGPAAPALFRPNTAAALRALGQAGVMARADMELLLAADFMWRSIQGITRITGMRLRDENPPASMLAPLLKAVGAIDLNGLRATMANKRVMVRECFIRLVGPLPTGETDR